MTYIKEIVFAALICGLLARISPSGKTGSGKLVKYTASLAFLFVLISPLLGDMQAAPDIMGQLSELGEGETTANYSDGYRGSLEVVSQAICKAAAESASEHFAVSPDAFSIKIIIDESDSGDYSIREATVYPKGTAENIRAGDIEAYFERILECPVEVIENE